MEKELKKKRIYELVESIDDEDKLDSLILEATYLTNSGDGMDGLTKEQYERLLESIEQGKQGKTKTNEEVMKMVNQWLTK